MFYVTLTWPWVPGQSYRLYLLDGAKPDPMRRLLSIGFSKKDKSLFISPAFEGESTLMLVEDGKSISSSRPAGSDFHISFHESGVINLSAPGIRERLQQAIPRHAQASHVATFQVNSVENLPTASSEEFNSPTEKRLHLPILGFLHIAPIMLSVFCSNALVSWEPRQLGNRPQVHYKTELAQTECSFHFVVWQNSNMPSGEGDLAIQFGEEGDGYARA